MFHIVLVEPEIPQNAGNIARTCAATGAWLHLVRPLGFEVTDKYLKRAGLDYWPLVHVSYYDSFEEVCAAFPASRFSFYDQGQKTAQRRLFPRRGFSRVREGDQRAARGAASSTSRRVSAHSHDFRGAFSQSRKFCGHCLV